MRRSDPIVDEVAINDRSSRRSGRRRRSSSGELTNAPIDSVPDPALSVQEIRRVGPERASLLRHRVRFRRLDILGHAADQKTCCQNEKIRGFRQRHRLPSPVVAPLRLLATHPTVNLVCHSRQFRGLPRHTSYRTLCHTNSCDVPGAGRPRFTGNSRRVRIWATGLSRPSGLSSLVPAEGRKSQRNFHFAGDVATIAGRAVFRRTAESRIVV